jgi:enoyl-CoA hydratase/carnithine racemase
MRARDLVLTGRRIDAAEALAMGLISRVVPQAR